MAQRWSADKVLALAPDAASAAAARKLAGPAPWSEFGSGAGLVWGLCKGSGQKPYQIAVDLGGPAYHCSCPSRKFPCKHALALLLLWSSSAVPDVATPAEFAQHWQAGRAERAQKQQERLAAPTTPKDEAAAARRAEQRGDRVAAGLAELDLWLRDQVRSGIATASGGYQHVAPVAARMVDAQAPGIASMVRSLGGISGTGDGWPARLLAAYARLHLLVRAHDRLADLPDPLTATIRAHIGYPVAKETVLAGAAVADRWVVLGRRGVLDADVPFRRTWLRGEATGRHALVLEFDPRGSFGSADSATLLPGTAVEGDLHFYPGEHTMRALIGPRPTMSSPAAAPPPTAIEVLVGQWAAALERDPWLTEWPVVVAGVPVPTGDGWVLAESPDAAVPLNVAGLDPWLLVAVAGGRPVPVAGEWSGRAFRPITVWDGNAAVRL